MRAISLFLVAFFLGVASIFAGTIETGFIEGPWPKQRVQELEVGRYPVRWRYYASKHDGIFAGVRFDAPLPRQAAWELSNEYQEIGQKIPGVKAVRYLEQSPTREVVQLDVKVLGKRLTLTFEVEKEPPRMIRFRLVNEAVGEYRGVCVYEERPAGGAGAHQGGTTMALSTWLKPARPVPMRLLLIVERIALLQGAREFLERCDEKLKEHGARP